MKENIIIVLIIKKNKKVSKRSHHKSLKIFEREIRINKMNERKIWRIKFHVCLK